MVWIIIVIGLLIDQGVKWFVATHMVLGQTISVIPNFFSIQYYVNRGAAWSFLSTKSWGIYVLSVISIIASIILTIIVIRIKNKKLRFPLSLVLIGAIGNMIDRVFRQGVIDFISLQFGSYFFPVFNLADMCLVIGLVWTVIYMLVSDIKRGKK